MDYPRIEIGRAEDLTNQHFGKWTALYRTTNDKTGKAMWVCECSCESHTQKPVSARTLKAGTSTNCGCERKITLEEKKDKQIRKRDEQGNIISKKCFRCQQWLPLTEFWKNQSQKDGYSGECKHCQYSAKENRYNIYKKNAKKRQLKFLLNKEDFYNITSQPCYYCGEKNEYNGIDRIDTQIGYLKNNCVPCCEQCNKMKLDYSIEQWFYKMKQILSKWEGKENDLFRNTY